MVFTILLVLAVFAGASFHKEITVAKHVVIGLVKGVVQK